MDIRVVSHTHWDREWYLTAGRSRQRLVALIDELLDDAESDAAPFLLDGQAVVIEDYLAVRPERRELLARRLRDGWLEAGPWYVLADELIPSGEALVRNLLAGRRALTDLGATAPPVLYCPDSFGHPAALPALAHGFGCSVIILWRGLGGEGWPTGDTFRWHAPDGSSALVFHLPRDGYEYGSNLPADETALRARWDAIGPELVRRSRLGLLLLLNGADHHARQLALTVALATLRRVVAPARLTGSSLRDFAAELAERARGAELPMLEGELRRSYGYTWTLQGTFATRAHLKRRNASVERLLVRDTEPWAALATWNGAAARAPLIRAAWRTLLLSHPHDTLCGCAIDPVAHAMTARLDDAESQARGLRRDALEDIVGYSAVVARVQPAKWRSIVVVRNATARPRSGVAVLDVALTGEHVPVGPGSGNRPVSAVPGVTFALSDGGVQYQILDTYVRHDRVESPRHYPSDAIVHVTRVAVWIDDAAGYGTRCLSIDHEATRGPAAIAHPVSGGERSLSNGVLDVEVTIAGEVRLQSGDGGANCRTQIRLEDVGDAGDLYTHSPVDPVVASRCVDAIVTRAGPVRGEIEMRLRIDIPTRSARAGRSAELVATDVTITLTLDAGAPFLRVAARGENHARDHRLRIVFDTSIPGGAVHADATFAVVRREPIVASPEAASVEWPPPTAPLARYVTVADGARGVTIYADGLAEYEASASGAVAVTLVRAVGELSRNDLPERPGHAGWPAPTSDAQCLGPFDAGFAIYPHGARDDREIARIEQIADDVLLPLSGFTIRSALALPAPTAGMALEGDGLAFLACKESEDGGWLVVRCVNLTDRVIAGRWRFGRSVSEAHGARLDESLVAPLPVRGGTIEFDAPPRGIVTIIFR
ncbi:MAG: hypothetical protein WKG32_20105 [Gemmatimonadaceae bacterium]